MIGTQLRAFVFVLSTTAFTLQGRVESFQQRPNCPQNHLTLYRKGVPDSVLDQLTSYPPMCTRQTSLLIVAKSYHSAPFVRLSDYQLLRDGKLFYISPLISVYSTRLPRFMPLQNTPLHCPWNKEAPNKYIVLSSLKYSPMIKGQSAVSWELIPHSFYWFRVL